MCFRMGHGLTHQIPSGVGIDLPCQIRMLLPAELNSAARWMTNPMRPVNSDSTKLGSEDHLARKQRHPYPPNADRWPPLHGPTSRQTTQDGMPNFTSRSGYQNTGCVGIQELATRTRHRAQCTSRNPPLGGQIGSCHLLLGVRIEDPVAKFTFPVALGVPVRLHPLSAGWATPGGEHPSAPSAVRHSNHNANQNRKGEGEQCGAKHHNGGRGKQKNSRQSNQKGDGVEPEARQAPAPPQSSKNAINGHKSPILGLAAGRRRLPEPVSAVV